MKCGIISILGAHLKNFYEMNHLVSNLKRNNPNKLEDIYKDLDRYPEDVIINKINSINSDTLSSEDKETYLISIYYVANGLSQA